MPLFFLVLTCALWGLSFPLMKALHLELAQREPGISSWFLAAWLQSVRFALSALLLLPWTRFGRGIARLEWIQGLRLAFWGGIGMWLQADALAHTDASVSAFLTMAYCVMIPLWFCMRTLRWPGPRLIAASVMVMIGTALLSGVRPDQLKLGRGEVETLIASAFFGLQILNLDSPRYKGNRSLQVTLIMFAGIGLLFAPLAFLFAPRTELLWQVAATWPAASLVLTLTLFCTLGAFGLMNAWQSKVTATEAGFIYTTEPLFTSLYVPFLPGLLSVCLGIHYANESITAVFVFGAVLILGANLLMQVKKKEVLR